MRLLVILIFLNLVTAQFQKGTMSAASLFSYSASSNGGNTNHYMTTGTNPTQMDVVRIQPSFSYFINDKISADIWFGKYKYSQGDDLKLESKLYGIGITKYFFPFYYGMGYGLSNSTSNGYNSSGANIEFHLGSLFELSPYIFLDMGINYIQGIGEIQLTGNSEYSYDNEETILQMGVGIKAFF